jgi:uncharacterized protein
MDKKQIVFIHGADAFSDYESFLNYLRVDEITDPLGVNPSKRWHQTLREELFDTHEVYKPSMPNKENAKYLEWKIWFERYFQFLRDGVILIGHSQGGYFLAKYLSENKMPVSVQALFLLGAPFEKREDVQGEDGGDFAFDTVNLSNLIGQVSDVHIWHSEDDFVVPYAHALLYKGALPQAALHTFTDKNHFLIEEFPELIEEIQKL